MSNRFQHFRTDLDRYDDAWLNRELREWVGNLRVQLACALMKIATEREEQWIIDIGRSRHQILFEDCMYQILFGDIQSDYMDESMDTDQEVIQTTSDLPFAMATLQHRIEGRHAVFLRAKHRHDQGMVNSFVRLDRDNCYNVVYFRETSWSKSSSKREGIGGRNCFEVYQWQTGNKNVNPFVWHRRVYMRETADLARERLVSVISTHSFEEQRFSDHQQQQLDAQRQQ